MSADNAPTADRPFGADPYEDWIRERLAQAWDEGYKAFASQIICHCGAPVAYGFDGDPTHHRGMCERCDAVRCDAYPGACRIPPVSTEEGED